MDLFEIVFRKHCLLCRGLKLPLCEGQTGLGLRQFSLFAFF